MAENFKLFPSIDPVREYDIYRKSNPVDHDVYVKGIPYMFITTPRLNLNDTNTKRDSFLLYMKNYHSDIFNALNIENKKISPFIKLLTNSFRGIDGKDLASRTIDIGETFYGFKQTLPISIVDSQVGDTLTVTFEELKHLPVVKLHKLWVEYTEKVSRGLFSPSETAITKRFIDYVSSIYYFVLDFDGETILYWAKYTGAVPISVPYSSLVTNGFEHDIPELTVEYIYSYKEDMNPNILSDFNKVALLDGASLSYSTETPSKGFIPYLTQDDLMSYNFTDVSIKGTEVLVISQDARQPDSVTPKRKYKLRFFK